MKRLVEVYETEVELSPWTMRIVAQLGSNIVPVHKVDVEGGIRHGNAQKYLCITHSCPYYALKESRIFK